MQTKDIDHIQAFYRDNRQALYAYALSRVGSREWAEDVIHSVFVAVLKRDRLPEELRPFVFRSVRNCAIDVLRRRNRQSEVESFIEPVAQQDSTETRLLVEEALSTLSADERETVVMKSYTGLTFDEIAQVRSVSINTAASWYRRCLLYTSDAADE